MLHWLTGVHCISSPHLFLDREIGSCLSCMHTRTHAIRTHTSTTGTITYFLGITGVSSIYGIQGTVFTDIFRNVLYLPVLTVITHIYRGK